MSRRFQLWVSSLWFYIGILQYKYIYKPAKAVYCYFKYRKQRNQVRERYLKGK